MFFSAVTFSCEFYWFIAQVLAFDWAIKGWNVLVCTKRKEFYEDVVEKYEIYITFTCALQQ